MAGPARPTARVRTLPHPKPPFDPSVDPLVGNESVDDNLAECAELAMWKAIGSADRTVELRVDAGIVRLTGRLQSAAQLEAVTTAISQVPGVRGVVAEVFVPAAR
jgi:osmotically-inducible protein OsmY